MSEGKGINTQAHLNDFSETEGALVEDAPDIVEGAVANEVQNLVCRTEIDPLLLSRLCSFHSNTC